MTLDKRTGRPVGDHGTALQAIEWIVNHGDLDARLHTEEFLKGWLHGDLDEWPEFYAWLRKTEISGLINSAIDIGRKEGTRQGGTPYGYTVELWAKDSRVGEFYVTRSRVQKHLGVAQACVEHWKTIYNSENWCYKIVPLYKDATA